MLTARRKGLRSSVSRSISESKTFGVRGGEGMLVQGIGVTRSNTNDDDRSSDVGNLSLRALQLFSDRGRSWRVLHFASLHRTRFTTEGVRICGSMIGAAWPGG
jgi:hypothetical protein